MIGNEKYKLNFKTLLRGQQETYTPDTYGLNKKALQIITVFLLSTTVFADNYSLSFDGVDDYVELPSGIVSNSWSEVTFETWIYKDQKQSYEGIISQGPQSSGGEINYNF